MNKITSTSMILGMMAAASFAQDGACIKFENGTGHYDEHCYNSGLLDMEDGACYTMNADRKSENPQWINNTASQTWWWTKVSCGNASEESSSSEGPVATSSSDEPVVSSSSEAPAAESKCIKFVDGTGDYDKNCYNSGLEEMEEGACYTMNPDRGKSPMWINKFASQTWWWVKTSCGNASEESSSSVEEPIDESSSSVESSSSSEDVVSSSSETPAVESKCIEFVNGTADYENNCYKSGLENMEEGKCYALNPDRKGEYNVWVNNSASEKWWWVETDCGNGVAVSSSSVEESSSSEASVETSKCVEFKNGTGDYDQHCYKSGLMEMEEGKCYAWNSERGKPEIWVNNIATQTWWWVETSCEDEPIAESSSSVPAESSSSEDVESSSSETVESSSSEVAEQPGESGENGESGETGSEGETGNEGDAQSSSSETVESSSSVDPCNDGDTSNDVNYSCAVETSGSETGSEGETGNEGDVQSSSSCHVTCMASTGECTDGLAIETDRGACFLEVIDDTDPGYFLIDPIIPCESGEDGKNCETGSEGDVQSSSSEVENESEECAGNNGNGNGKGNCSENNGRGHGNGKGNKAEGARRFSADFGGETMGMTNSVAAKAAVSFSGKTLDVVASTNGNKTMKVFGMTGKLLGSESFTASSMSFDMSKYVGKGALVVRISEGSKVLATKQISIR